MTAPAPPTAAELDETDPLSGLRDEFDIPDGIYPAWPDLWAIRTAF